MRSQLTGRQGEAATADYLRKKGYKVIEANYATRFGEIDLIAKKHKTVVFVEVKTRKNRRFANAFEAVNAKKQAKIRACAEQWLAENDPGGQLCARFDVVEVYINDPAKPPFYLNHIENAFASEGYADERRPAF